MATIKDIAALSGYSIGTVSRVINGHPDVSNKAKEKILKIIEEQHYQPNANAKYLKQQGQGEISIIVKGTNNTFLSRLLEEVQMNLSKNQEGANVVFIDEVKNEVTVAKKTCRERKSKGLIFLGANVRSFQEGFSDIDVPSVLVTETAESLGFDNLSSFATDDLKASVEAVEALIKAGHKRIGIVGGSISSEHGLVGSRRISGAIGRIREEGLQFDEKRDFEGSRFSIEDGYNAAKKLLERADDITAIFAASDLVAVGAMRACADKGLNVPQDISIIGFDGIKYTRFSIPRVATIWQNIELLAKKSVDDLLLRLNYNRPAVHEKIPYKLLEGESIASPKEQ